MGAEAVEGTRSTGVAAPCSFLTSPPALLGPGAGADGGDQEEFGPSEIAVNGCA